MGERTVTPESAWTAAAPLLALNALGPKWRGRPASHLVGAFGRGAPPRILGAYGAFEPLASLASATGPPAP